jgi:hypothetical protein
VADHNTCRWCGAEQLFGPVRLHATVAGDTADVKAAVAPTTGMGRRMTTVPIAVWACHQCGHLAAFAQDIEPLYQRWLAGER